jgi:hypothetical protein
MMQSKLESLDAYSVESAKCACVWLLKEIQGITHRFEGTRNVFISLDDAWCSYYGYHQGAHQTLHEYLKEYQSLVQVLEHYGAAIGSEGPYLEQVKDKVKAASKTHMTDSDVKTKSLAAAKLQSIAMGFMKCADKRRYGGLWSNLENSFSRGQDHYPPSDLTGAYNLLLNYKAPPPVLRRHECEHGNNEDALSFLQEGESNIPGNDGVTHDNIKCFKCNKYGHFANHCPDEEGVTMLQLTSTADDDDTYVSGVTFLNVREPDAFIFAQAPHNMIPHTWILLESQWTVSVFKNRNFLTNIRPSVRTLRVHTNGGTQTSNQIGSVPNFGNVWYNTTSLENILSMAEVRRNGCRITMDTAVEAAMTVHRSNSSLMKFHEFKSGLYYYHTKQEQTNLSSNNDTDYLFLNTVADNKKNTQREIEGADRARKLYIKIE